MTAKKNVKRVPIGEDIAIGAPAGFMVLPDGVVVTCRSTYTVQHEGRHQVGDLVFDGVKRADKAE